TGTLLYVGLTLLIMIFILSAAVLIYCRKTGCEPKGPPQEAEYANVTETEDDSSKLTYSVVHLSNGAAAPLNSAPRGDADNAAYSVLQAAASSDDRHAEHASAPLSNHSETKLDSWTFSNISPINLHTDNNTEFNLHFRRLHTFINTDLHFRKLHTFINTDTSCTSR
ncbi:hypothetical protein GBF38_015665, partial [Nibea albiflora]